MAIKPTIDRFPFADGNSFYSHVVGARGNRFNRPYSEKTIRLSKLAVLSIFAKYSRSGKPEMLCV